MMTTLDQATRRAYQTRRLAEQAAQIADLQAANTALIEEVNAQRRTLADRDTVIALLQTILQAAQEDRDFYIARLVDMQTAGSIWGAIEAAEGRQG